MNIQELVEMSPSSSVDVQLCHDRIDALEQRLAYAKELLLTYGQPGVWKNIEAFIEKLNSEGF